MTQTQTPQNSQTSQDSAHRSQVLKSIQEQDDALHQEVISLLKGSERWIYRLQEKLNRNPSRESLTMRVTSLVGEPFIRLITKHR